MKYHMPFPTEYIAQEEMIRKKLITTLKLFGLKFSFSRQMKLLSPFRHFSNNLREANNLLVPVLINSVGILPVQMPFFKDLMAIARKSCPICIL